MPGKIGSSDSQCLYPVEEDDDGDADGDYAKKMLYIDEGNNGCFDQGSSDNKKEKKTSGNGDDELFYSSNEEYNAEFERNWTRLYVSSSIEIQSTLNMGAVIRLGLWVDQCILTMKGCLPLRKNFHRMSI